MAQVGIQQYADGTQVPVRAGRFGEIVTGHMSGQYFELAKQGRVFMASMQAGAVFGIALTATAVTLSLYNPAASGVYLSILQTTVAMTATQVTTATGESIVYAANSDPSVAAPTALTALTVVPAILGVAGSPKGNAYSAATLPAAPKAVRVHPFNYNCFTTNAAGAGGAAVDWVDGALGLAPNTIVTLQGLATTTQITAIASIVWAEIPI